MAVVFMPFICYSCGGGSETCHFFGKAFYADIFPQPIASESLVLLVVCFRRMFCLYDLSEVSDSKNLFYYSFSHVAGPSFLQTISACRVKCIFFQWSFDIFFTEYLF